MDRTTLEIIAPSLEEAIARGQEQLNVSRDQFDVEVLDEGSKGFLGFGSRQVRIRLTLKAVAAPKQEESTSAPVTQDLPTATDTSDDLLTFASQVSAELLEKMNLRAQVSATYGPAEEDGEVPILIDVRGDDLSILIGRRAETLNALQYILGLIVSKQAEHWVQVVVDVEGYRARREKQLRQLARRMADQAVRTGKRQVLEPMSSSERRIVHLELRSIPDVVSESIGEDPNRKVTIQLKK